MSLSCGLKSNQWIHDHAAPPVWSFIHHTHVILHSIFMELFPSNYCPGVSALAGVTSQVTTIPSPAAYMQATTSPHRAAIYHTYHLPCLQATRTKETTKRMPYNPAHANLHAPPMQASMQPSLAATLMQATHTKESTERMLLVAYAHKASIPNPLTKAYAIAASYPYAANSPAILAAIVQRLERRALIVEEE